MLRPIDEPVLPSGPDPIIQVNAARSTNTPAVRSSPHEATRSERRHYP
jgi:hypothetical protein